MNTKTHGQQPISRRQLPREAGPQASIGVAISWESVEAIARRVVELLQEHGDREFVDAQELARILGISRSTVYERAGELGAIRLGCGSRARLRFNVAEATAALRAPEPRTQRTTRRTQPRCRRQHRIAEADLLPIRGERPLSAGRR